MPVVAAPALKWAAVLALGAMGYGVVKEGKGIAEAGSDALKWGVVGGGIYIAAKAAKVI